MTRGSGVIRYDGKKGVVWRIKFRDADGTQVMETIGAERDGVTRKKAESELRERLVRVERKSYRRPKALTFGEYAQTWFSEGETKRRWKPGTLKVYGAIQRRLVAYFGGYPLDAIRPRDVAAYITHHADDLVPASVGRDVNILHAIFKTAVREERAEFNPAAGAETPKLPRRGWRILEPVEVARVLKAFTDEQARTAFLTLVLTGVRRHELQALRWRDVDLVEDVLRIRDSKSESGIRSIAITPKLAEALWQHRRATSFQGDDEFVFAHPTRGTKYDALTFQAQFNAALKAAGIDDYVRPFHDLRHTGITNDAAAGANPIALMTKAGHSNMKTTQTYLHVAGVVFRDEAAKLEARLLGDESEALASVA